MDYLQDVINAFHAKHGPECYSDGGMIHYADGAYRDADPRGILAPPPRANDAESEWRLFSNKLTFQKLKLAAAVREFDELNERLQFWNPADQETALTGLEKLKATVEERRGFVAEAEKALEETSWGRRHRERIQEQAEERQRAAEFQSRRRAIRI